MTETVITLDALELVNFKGIKNFKIENIGQMMNIYGANETGKTTLVDAWRWLLYGKNSLDDAKFGIKNQVDKSLNTADHIVTGKLTKNGEVYELKRTMAELWQKPQGQTEKVFNGNVTSFSINNVPMKAGEYEKAVSEILDEKYSKILTDPLYFNNDKVYKWEDRRSVLFNMAGDLSNRAIAGENKVLIALLDKIGNKTLIQYKKEISATKKLKKDAAEKIPVQISEVKRQMPDKIDFAATQKSIDEKKSAILDIDTSISDVNKSNTKFNEKVKEHNNKISSLETEISNFVQSKQKEIQQENHNEEIKVNDLKNKVSSIESNINSKKGVIASTEKSLAELQQKKEAKLKEWGEINSKQMAPFAKDEKDFVCPTCKRALEAEDIEAKKKELTAAFNNDKIDKKSIIEKEGFDLNKKIGTDTEILNGLKSALQTLETELATAKKVIEDYQAPENKTPLTALQILQQNPDYKQKANQVDELKAVVFNADEKQDTADLIKQKQGLQSEIDELNQILGKKGERERAEARIIELEKQEKDLNQEIADYEKDENLIDSFSKAKVEETEKRINGLFKDVTFKMYDETQDGNPVDTCKTIYKGVEWKDLNTAGKIWAGLRIIEALSDYYKVKAPIFIDNRESTTIIPEIGTQIISLIVSPDDRYLRVENMI